MVEDNEDTAVVIKEYLVDEGFKVDIAVTGRAALDSFQKTRHNLLITDYLLPDTNGYALVQQCLGISENIKVIYITGVDVKQKLSSVQIGRDCQILKKPTRPSEILKTIKMMF